MDKEQKELNDDNCVTTSVDAYNRLDLKPYRIFIPQTDIKVRLIKFDDLKGETVGILTEHSKSLAYENIISCCVDNTNKHFGGVRRQRPQQRTNGNLLGIGCCAYSIDNCVRNSVD